MILATVKAKPEIVALIGSNKIFRGGNKYQRHFLVNKKWRLKFIFFEGCRYVI